MKYKYKNIYLDKLIRLCFLVIFISIFIFSCKNENEYKNVNGFLIRVDTINIDVKDFFEPASRIELKNAVELDDNFYCIFEQCEIYDYYEGNRLFVIFNKNGKKLKCFPVPDGIHNSVFCDLFIRNDSIIAKSNTGEYETYYFDIEKENWLQINEADDVLFEDKNYYVTFIDYGEWGYTTWFKDKTNNIQYELATNSLVINKTSKAYYITNQYQIIKVENPRNLRVCSKENYYENAKKRETFYERKNYKLDGAKIIYQDSANPWNYYAYRRVNTTIITSFVYNNSLFHLCADSLGLFVGILNKNNFKQVVRFDNFNQEYCLWENANRFNNQTGKGQLLAFTDCFKNNSSGLFKIKENSIDLFYIKHNIDTAQYIHKEVFAELINRLFSKDFESISQVENFEKSIKGLQINCKTLFSSKNEIQLLDTLSKTFLRVQDSYFASKTKYYYDKNTKQMISIDIDWLPTKFYDGERQKDINNIFEDPMDKAFRSKLNELIQIINRKFKVTPTFIEIPTKLPKYKWYSNSKNSIELYYSEVTHEIYIEIKLQTKTSP